VKKLINTILKYVITKQM